MTIGPICNAGSAVDHCLVSPISRFHTGSSHDAVLGSTIVGGFLRMERPCDVNVMGDAVFDDPKSQWRRSSPMYAASVSRSDARCPAVANVSLVQRSASLPGAVLVRH